MLFIFSTQIFPRILLLFKNGVVFLENVDVSYFLSNKGEFQTNKLLNFLNCVFKDFCC